MKVSTVSSEVREDLTWDKSLVSWYQDSPVDEYNNDWEADGGSVEDTEESAVFRRVVLLWW